MNFDFQNSIATIPGVKYETSFFTLFNCPKVGCDLAQDIISVRFKEGIDGVYKEVYRIVGKDNDDRWNRNYFTYIATSNRLYVRFFLILFFAFLRFLKIFKIRFVFSRARNQGSDSVGNFYVDQIQFQKYSRMIKFLFENKLTFSES